MLVFRLVRILTLVMVTGALGVTHAASAATFDGVGNHTLTSSNLSFNWPALGAGWSCTSTIFEVNVPAGGATATLTGVTVSSCVGTGALAGVPADVTVTNLPWEFTRTAAGTFDITGIHMTLNFTGVTNATLEGNLEGSINNTTHTVTFANSPGLTLTSAIGNSPQTVTGDFRDDQNTLAVT
jgi:hypothetical protein